jgi:hypothetical protein
VAVVVVLVVLLICDHIFAVVVVLLIKVVFTLRKGGWMCTEVDELLKEP